MQKRESFSQMYFFYIFHFFAGTQGSYKKLQPFFQDFSRTECDFQGPQTGMLFQGWQIYTGRFQTIRFSRSQVFAPSPLPGSEVPLFTYDKMTQKKHVVCAGSWNVTHTTPVQFGFGLHLDSHLTRCYSQLAYFAVFASSLTSQ